MNARAKGWCPDALRPMLSGDGLLLRLRVSCGELPLKLAREIADWSQDFGNGALDLSSRGALQLRGVRAAALPALTERLREAGLIAANPEAEAVRNVAVSPFAGLDPAAPCDVRPYARAWEAELSRNPALWALPGKFGASFDAGAFPLGLHADLMFRAIASDAFIVGLGKNAALGPFSGDRLVSVATALARAFLALRETPADRMRDALRAHGLSAFAEVAGLSPTPQAAAPTKAPDWIGAHALGDAAFVGFALPFGRLAAADLAGLADLAERAGGTALRLTPWRGVLAPLPSLAAAIDLADGARDLGVIVDPNNPLLAVAACPGAPACASALGETRELARQLAPFLDPRSDGVALHVSGCPKGCAHPAAAPLTVVATERGYDLIIRGRADAAPQTRSVTPEALRRLMQVTA